MRILKWFSITCMSGPTPLGGVRSQRVLVTYDDDYGLTNTFPSLDEALEDLEAYGYIDRQAFTDVAISTMVQ